MNEDVERPSKITVNYLDENFVEHEEEFSELKVRDKDWYTVKYGYFVLVSNIDASPKELLSDYFCRTEIDLIICRNLKNTMEITTLFR